MTFWKAAVAISIAIFGAGVKFWLDNPEKLRGPLVMAVGLGGVIWSIVKARPQGGPIVEPTRYDFDHDTHEGFYLSSHPEPAYGVRIPPIPLLGELHLNFDDTLGRLDAEGFLAAEIMLRGATQPGLDNVWRNIHALTGAPDAFRFVIEYRAASGDRYRSICELRRDATKPRPGFDVRFIRRDKIGWFERWRTRGIAA
jgi:hypothetical protein